MAQKASNRNRPRAGASVAGETRTESWGLHFHSVMTYKCTRLNQRVSQPMSHMKALCRLASRPTVAATLLVALVYGCAGDSDHPQWIGTWSAAQHANDSPRRVENQTIRQVVRTSVGGERVRVRLSNLFGTTPLQIDAASLARSAGEASVEPDSLVHLAFGGEPTVVIAPGAEVTSDPVDVAVTPLEELALSLYFAAPVALGTSHSIALRNAFVSDGNQTLAESLPSASTIGSWFVITGLEVMQRPPPRVIVAIGDSITDGFGSRQPNGSWPERLAQRLEGRASVLNSGISGNRILRTGLATFGPSALERFERDVLRQPGATTVIVQEGINDLQAPAVPAVFGDDPPSPPVTSDELIAGLREIIARARNAGLTVIGGTLLPYPPLSLLIDGGEVTRTEVNLWIRESGEFDAVIDFDAALRDPDNPQQMFPEYDSGDTLHPSDAGYQAMANAAFEVLDSRF